MSKLPVDLIAIDLDGTLYGDDLTISARNKAAIAAARDLGVRIALASGRMVYDIAARARELGLLPPDLPAAQATPILSNQGCIVYDLIADRPLLVQPLELELTERVIRYLRRLGQSVNLHTVKHTYRERTTPGDQLYAELSRLDEVIVVPDLIACLQAGDDQPLKLVMVNEPAVTLALIEQLRAEFGGLVEVTRSHSLYAEVMDLRATKGNALAFLANYLHIPRARVMAIGDNWNDLSMLQWAGCGVAMGHADQTVRDAAAFVTDTLADDGVATAIERLVLERA